MDIIASDALKNTNWGHMVKTKTKGLLSITYTQNNSPPPSSLIYSGKDTLLNLLSKKQNTLTLQQISLA